MAPPRLSAVGGSLAASPSGERHRAQYTGGDYTAPPWPSESEQCGDSHGCYPRLFIIGTQKGATTSVFKALKKQGSACGAVFPETWPNLGPQVSDKEAHVFDMASSNWAKVLQAKAEYRKLYRLQNCPTRYFVDGTPRYSRTPVAAARIPELLPSSWVPQLRFLMSIREPIARDLSWFNHRLSAKARSQPWYTMRQRAHAERSASASAAIQPISLPDDAFCSVPNDSPEFPTYEAEVFCRKKELNDCISLGARQRLSSAASGLPTERASQRHPEEAAVEASDAARLADFEWCIQEVWPNWNNHNSSRDVLKGRRVESPVLAWGIYLPQIRAFIKSAKVQRSQLLVLSFERLVTEPKNSLKRVTKFYGLPEMENNTLPHTNVQDSGHKVDVISCESRAVLQRLYGDWNQMLEHALRVDRNKVRVRVRVRVRVSQGLGSGSGLGLGLTL